MALVFFPPLKLVIDGRTTNIDSTWSTHKPLDVPNSVELSIAEVVSVVYQMRPKTALGLDDIPVSILKENIFIIAPWLALIYIALLSLHHSLESWKIAKFILLKNPVKSLYFIPYSY